MTFETSIFYVFAALIGISALIILVSKNVLYSAFSLLLTFLGVAAVYVFARADFIATAQIIVYGGGILVLLMFGVMFTKKSRATGVTTGNRKVLPGLVLGGSLFALLASYIPAIELNGSYLKDEKLMEQFEGSKVSVLGVGLMTDYVIPFELAAILLLVALIGAAYIAGKELKK